MNEQTLDSIGEGIKFLAFILSGIVIFVSNYNLWIGNSSLITFFITTPFVAYIVIYAFGYILLSFADR